MLISGGRLFSSFLAAIITETNGSVTELEIGRILCLNKPDIINSSKKR